MPTKRLSSTVLSSNGDILAASDENAMFAAKDRQPLNF